MDKFYITTPIYYVNARPHIGHAYTTIAADCLARYWRSQGRKVHFLTGTDEHGQKIQKAAAEQGLTPIQFTDQISPKFRDLWTTLEVANDDFIRTTEDRHVRTVQRVLEIVKGSGDLYEGEYGGWYCVPCETFWTEGQTIEGKCPDCHRPVEHIKEKNYFFRLSKYQGWLLDHIRRNPAFIFPQTRYNEVLSFLENNTLTDLCISRPKSRLSWGIPLPFAPDHVTYVWFDALINYISAIGFVDDRRMFEALWPADVHMMAKDIIRQHAIYWPIMLKAIGLEPPRQVVAHGWWKMGEIKMSKSLGNVVDPVEMVERYGVDSFRYFLMRDVNFGDDGNFSTESFEQRFNGDLANDLGNLVYRTVNMVLKYTDGKLSEGAPIFPEGIDNPVLEAFIKDGKGAVDAGVLAPSFTGLRFTEALDTIWEPIKAANRFVEQVKPWTLHKDGRADEVMNFLKILRAVLRASAATLAPFMPATARAIADQVGGPTVIKGEPLFPRLESGKS